MGLDKNNLRKHLPPKIWVPILIAVVLVVSYGVLAQTYSWWPFEQQRIGPDTQTTETGRVIWTGEIICLPHKPFVPPTEECAIGFGTEQGNYALKFNGVELEFNTGDKVRIIGDLGPAGETKYDVKGEIKVISIERANISTWKTYRNQEFGFEVKYPENWKFDRFGQDFFKFSSPIGDLFITISPSGGFGMGLPSEPSKISTIKFGNISAKVEEWSNFEVITLLDEIPNWTTDNIVFNVEFKNNKLLLDQILSTFKFIK